MIGETNFYELEIEKYWSGTKKENIRELAKTFVFSGDFIGARKIDGFFMMLCKNDDGTIWMRGRSKSVSGEYLNKIDWVPHIKEALRDVPNGTVFLGEIYLPNNESSKNVTTILGCLKDKALARQAKEEDKLHFYIFDILALNGDVLINKSLEERTKILLETKMVLNSPYIHVARYYEGEELWSYIGWALENGYEGVVIQRKDAPYTPGKRTARKTLKIKKEIGIEINAYMTGRVKIGTLDYKGTEPEHWKYWLNNKTDVLLEGEENYDSYILGSSVIPVTKDFFFGLASSIEFAVIDKNGEDVSLCWISNITDELKWQIKEDENNCRGKVAKITAMEIDSASGSLRHSKIKEWRNDINYLDCTLESIVNL